MSSEITYFVSYACPSCRTQLEAGSTRWDGWLRCPVCKWPSLPPEIIVDRRQTRRRTAQQIVDDDILVIPGSLEDAVEPNSRGTRRQEGSSADVGRSSHTTPARLIFTTGFAFSLFLVLVAFMQERMGNAAIFGILAGGFLLMLVRAPRNRVSS